MIGSFFLQLKKQSSSKSVFWGSVVVMLLILLIGWVVRLIAVAEFGTEAVFISSKV